MHRSNMANKGLFIQRHFSLLAKLTLSLLDRPKLSPLLFYSV